MPTTVLGSLRHRVVAILLAVVSGVAAVAAFTSPAFASGSYSNASIADLALAHVGETYGECWPFVRDMIYQASDHTQDISAAAGGGDYFAHLQNAGGQRITDQSQLSKGDVVQNGEYDNSAGLHTFIIVGLVSGNTYDVVDSNHMVDHVVRRYNRTFSLSDTQRAYRFGSVTTPPPPNRVTGGGALSTRGNQRLDLFIQGTNTSGANTYHNWSDAAPWVGWHLLEASAPTRVSSAVASVSWNSNRIDLFARGEDGTLLHKWWNADTGWGDWVSNGGCIVGAPTVTSWGPGRLDVFAQGCNATGPNLVHNWYDGTNWWWETVAESGGSRIASAPSATAWSYGRIDIFGQSTSGTMLHKWYNTDSGWGDWVSNGGCVQGAPAVSSWAAGRLDVFAPGCYSSGNNLVHNWWDGSNWHWELVPGSDNLHVTNVLGAVSWGYGRIDIAGRSTAGEPVHKWYDGTAWYNWEHLGGGVAP